MKKYFLSLTTILMVALTSVCFVSCGDDDDNGSSSGNSTSSGVVVNAKYGFYRMYGAREWELMFSNYDIQSPDMMSKSLDIVAIELDTDTEYTEIPTGEFTRFSIVITKGMKGQKDPEAYYESGSRKNATGKLTIKKNGGNYTVSYSGVSFYGDDSDKPTVEGASFSYTGSIVKINNGNNK